MTGSERKRLAREKRRWKKKRKKEIERELLIPNEFDVFCLKYQYGHPCQPVEYVHKASFATVEECKNFLRARSWEGMIYESWSNVLMEDTLRMQEKKVPFSSYNNDWKQDGF